MKHDTAVPIGAGGMGEVFKAWDPDLERHVALKYLKNDDPVLVERLLREARAQARIDHPSVCKVYEVGEDDGRPFIAMEYVEGDPLDVAAAKLSLEQKVLLVTKIAEAIQAAHSAGLVHRDLKPANILVVDRDGLPHPYVLDFGIARIEEVAGLTMTGQVMGTPGYISPEQARGDLRAVDRRTDVFSLGVLLYEVLGGTRPFAGDSNVEILMHLIDDEAPPLRRVAPAVPRDLETVVMTCLEKDPDRRYPSAQALVDDLGRWLEGEPVEARSIGLAERLLRRARKNPVATTAIAAAAVALLALAGVALGGWIKYTGDLEAERDVARAREAEARAVADFLVDVFSTSDPDDSHGEEVTAREILDVGARRIEKELGDQPAVQARLLGVMGQAYSRLGLYEQAAPLLDQGLEQVLGLPEPDPEAEIEARVRLVDIRLHERNLDDAAGLAGPLPSLADAAGVSPAHAAQALGCVGKVRILEGDAADAVETLTRAVERAEVELGRDSTVVAHLLTVVTQAHVNLGQWSPAITASRRALEIRERAYGPDDPRVASTLNALTDALRQAGRIEEAVETGERALELYRRTLGSDHPRTSTAMNNLALANRQLGRLDRAEELYQGALDIRIRAFGEDHPRTATVYGNLARVYLERGEFDRAEAATRRALEIGEQNLGADHPQNYYWIAGLWRIFNDQGRHAEAEGFAERALAIREAAHGADSPTLVDCLLMRGRSRIGLGRLDEAAGDLERARRIAGDAGDDGRDDLTEINQLLATIEAERELSAG